MRRAFPDNLVQCHGEGRVSKVDIRVKPMSFAELVEGMHRMQSAIDSLHLELAKLCRTQKLMFHNLAALTKEWTEVNSDLVESLHP